MRSRLAIGFFAFSFLQLDVSAEPAKPSGTTKPRYLTTSFDPSAEKLPPGFLGHSITEILKESVLRPKGEYETTDDFQKRASAKRKSTTYAIRAGERPTTSYHPDGGYLTVLPARVLVYTGFKIRPELLAYTVMHSEIASDSYIGTNAFGATLRVAKRSFRHVNIIAGTTRRYGEATELLVPLTVSQAKAVREHLRVLFVCSTDVPQHEQPPAILSDLAYGPATGYHSKEPTFSSPEDTATFYHSVRLKVREIWVFDARSGKVYGKFDAYGAPRDQWETVAANQDFLLTELKIGDSKERLEEVMASSPDETLLFEDSTGRYGLWIYRHQRLQFLLTLPGGEIAKIERLTD